MVKELSDKSPAEAEGSTDPLSGLSATQLKATQESLPVFLEAMWHVSVLDIERTVNSVTHKLCRDHSVTPAERLLRAQALAVRGDIFLAAAVLHGGSKDPKEKVAEMVAIMVPGASGGGAGGAGGGAAGSCGSSGAGGGGAGGGAPPGSAPAAPPLSAAEMRQLKPSELKRRLRGMGVTEFNVTEKEELVQLVLEKQKEQR